MSNEEIMKPRYKVIADWPDNIYFKVGETVTLKEIDNREHLEPMAYVQQHSIHSSLTYPEYRCFYQIKFDRYPHLFRRMHWSEERAVKDMPEYVKSTGDGYTMPVTKHFYESNFNSAGIWPFKGNIKYFIGADSKTYMYYGWIPASREEYEQYNQPKKK